MKRFLTFPVELLDPGIWLLFYILLHLINPLPALAQIEDRSPAWLQGFADGKECVKLVDGCTFKNPYIVESPDPATRNQEANDNSDYIGGFIAGKSAANQS